ncbi:MAG: helix-turn-helix domain-containing protein [Theionarchaea archaeon]|nr:helix-turn-helix domain-containing protein [Theionarchaea archaeon]
MDVVIERWKLLQLAEEEHLTVAEACHRLGVSWKIYYKWRSRFREEGIDGLKNRSRRPGLSPRKTDVETKSEIVRERRYTDGLSEGIPIHCGRWISWAHFPSMV